MTVLDQVPVRSAPLPPPRPPRVRGSDVTAIAGFVVAVTLGLWMAHGGITELLAGGIRTVSAVGQVTGFVAALAALAGLVLTSRPRWLERRYGQDRLVSWHRWAGITTVLAVVVHAVADSWAWGAATGGTAVTGLIALLGEPWMVAATVATVLMLVIGLSSWRRLRRRLSYETWYFVHLAGYLAVLMGFAHQLTLGSDLAGDPLAYWWWVGLFVAVVAIVLWSRLGDLLRSLTRPLAVTAVTAEAPGVGSLHLTGPGIHRMRARAGQFFNVRVLTSDLWWQAHPFSLSAAPSSVGLRFTIKALGDDSARILSLPPGTRVLLEGPYGAFTADRAEGHPVLLVAGGVGIAPIRAILADCTAAQRPVVIVRVREAADLAHRDELEHLLARRRGRLEVVTGRRSALARNPFSASALQATVPDLSDRHAFVCGPESLQRAVISGLRAAGVPSRRIHHERFGL